LISNASINHQRREGNMESTTSFLLVIHLIGLSLGVGSGTAKFVLLLKCNKDPSFVAVYLKIMRPLTRLIILGLILLTLSGIGWLLLGYTITSLLIVKLVLVAAIWVLGPVIDNSVEPRFKRLAPAPGEATTPEFVRSLKQYLMLEGLADLLFYCIIFFWVLA
jgi:hypothetical protein